MPVITNIMDYLQVAEAVQATGTWDSVAQAVESGAVYQVGQNAYTAFQVIQGGAAAPVTSLQDSALEIAKRAGSLGATAAAVKTAAGTILKNATTGVVKAAGLLTLEVPTVAASCAPLAGVVLGNELYNKNPELWTKISQTLLPFCYEENKIQAFCDFVTDAETGLIKPVVLLPTAIINALKDLFRSEGIPVDGNIEYEATGGESAAPWPDSILCGDVYDDQGYGTNNNVHYTQNGAVAAFLYPNTALLAASESVYAVKRVYTSLYGEVTEYDELLLTNSYTYNGQTVYFSDSNASPDIFFYRNFPMNERISGVVSDSAAKAAWRIIYGNKSGTTAWPEGVSAPTTPVEPIVWPDTPIIIVPEPLGPDYQPIPVTPVTPALPPAPETPLLPEHVPDPTPEKPDEWPEEEPWPTTIPFPLQPTEPVPDWPEVMPWPLPADPPEEWPTTPWPSIWPEELPWPRTPEEWPETVPWPDTKPEEWPETEPAPEPWPESPEEWPETVPWPVPWPENWPEEEPWPIKWPDDVPYPWPFPYPYPSQDPYPDPEEIDDPTKRVDPYIDPWPYPWPDPYPDPAPNPDPYRDPSQPQPRVEPEPKPYPEPDDPYPTPPKGEPTPPIPPIIPLPFSSTTGLISVYHPTQSELLSFAQWLWVTWQDATIEKIWNNPFDGVITLFELYCTPTDVGRKNIRSGFLDSGVSSETISRYTSIDCGSIGVPEYYGNYFDYAPYSKCHIYLPFIGIVELNVDDIVGHGVNVTYRIDEYNGSCIAMITCAKSATINGEEVDYSTVVYQFSGNCAVELPLAGGSQAAIKAGMLEAAAWGIGSVIGGVMGGSSIGEIGQGLAYGAASAVHSVVSAKSSVQHSGSFGSSYGAMGAKKPYIIVTRPKQIQVPNYNELYGYQAHKMVRVGDCTGYLRCREVHVISPTASDEEKVQIEQLLKTGVYVTE